MPTETPKPPPPAPEPNDDLRPHLVENLKRFEEMLAKMPGTSDVAGKVRELRRLLAEQRPPRLAIVGRRGSGKSSLVNAIFGAEIAEVGHEKAQTAKAAWFRFQDGKGALDLLDTRGFQEGSVPEGATGTALEALRHELDHKAPDLFLFVVKASDVDSAIEEDLSALAEAWKAVFHTHRFRTPVFAVVTHADEVEPKNVRLDALGKAPAIDTQEKEEEEERREKKERLARLERAIEAKLRAHGVLREHVVRALAVSSYQSWRADHTRRADERYRIDELVTMLFRELPEEARLELARLSQLHALQEEIALRITHLTATACAAVGAAPIPMADIVPITSMQAGMVVGIGYVAGRTMTTAAAAEFLGAMGFNVGAGYLFRQAARQAVKLLPAAGALLSSLVAYAGTYGLGRAAIAYFIRGVGLDDAKRVLSREKQRAEMPGREPGDKEGKPSGLP